MNTNEINANSKILKILLDRAVLDVMVWTHNNCVNVPQEPDYMAALTTRFTRNLYQYYNQCSLEICFLLRECFAIKNQSWI